MTNNDIFRRLRYLLNINDLKMIALFSLVDCKVTKEMVKNWLSKDEDPNFMEITDKELASFLNGLIIDNRGRRQGPLPIAEDPLSNNLILRKLRIAFDYKTDDILDIFALDKTKISKHELSAFFRSPDHKSYRPCMDQYLRAFLSGLQTKFNNEKPQGN